MTDQPREPRYLPIEGFDGYRVDRDGFVWSAWQRRGHLAFIGDSWKRIAGGRKASGHRYVIMTQGGVKKNVQVHRIVLKTFVGPCPEGMEACHGNGLPWDNRLDNLRWDTPTNNQADKKAHGTDPRGERNPASKLTKDHVKQMFALSDQGLSLRQIAERYGVYKQTVHSILRGKLWGHLGLASAPRTATA